MNTLSHFEITIISATALMLLCVPGMRALAIRIGLVDKPNHRKVHQVPVPVVGGVCVGIVVAIAAGLNEVFLSALPSNLVWVGGSIIMLLIGVLDDRFNISAALRLVIQLSVAIAVAYSGIRITSLYGIFGIYELPLVMQYVITAVTIAGVVNAFNLMDGIDGLLGSLALVASVSIGFLAYNANLFDLVALLAAVIGALIGFLRFNLGKKKIFMGDAGSLALGFVLVVSAIRVLQASASQPISEQVKILLLIAAIFLVPVLDSLRVYRGRIKKGTSPFKADKTHLHHLFLFVGTTHRRATAMILMLVLSIVTVVASMVYLVPATWVILSAALVFGLVAGFMTMRHSVGEWAERLKKLERGQHN